MTADGSFPSRPRSPAARPTTSPSRRTRAARAARRNGRARSPPPTSRGVAVRAAPASPDLLGRRQHLRASRGGSCSADNGGDDLSPDRQRLLRLRDQARQRRRLRRRLQDETRRPGLQRRQEQQRHDRGCRRHEAWASAAVQAPGYRGHRRLQIAPTAPLGSRVGFAINDGALLDSTSQAVSARAQPLATSGSPRRTPATSPPRSSSPRRSSRAASRQGLPCAPRTAARTPTSGSTSGTTAASNSGSTSATPAPGFSSAAPTTRARWPPARRCN